MPGGQARGGEAPGVDGGRRGGGQARGGEAAGADGGRIGAERSGAVRSSSSPRLTVFAGRFSWGQTPPSPEGTRQQGQDVVFRARPDSGAAPQWRAAAVPLHWRGPVVALHPLPEGGDGGPHHRRFVFFAAVFFAAKKAAWPRCSSVRLVSRSFGIMFPAWTGVSHTQLHDAQTCCCTQSLHVSSETTCVCSAMKK